MGGKVGYFEEFGAGGWLVLIVEFAVFVGLVGGVEFHFEFVGEVAGVVVCVLKVSAAHVSPCPALLVKWV